MSMDMWFLLLTGIVYIASGRLSPEPRFSYLGGAIFVGLVIIIRFGGLQVRWDPLLLGASGLFLVLRYFRHKKEKRLDYFILGAVLLIFSVARYVVP